MVEQAVADVKDRPTRVTMGEWLECRYPTGRMSEKMKYYAKHGHLVKLRDALLARGTIIGPQAVSSKDNARRQIVARRELDALSKNKKFTSMNINLADASLEVAQIEPVVLREPLTKTDVNLGTFTLMLRGYDVKVTALTLTTTRSKWHPHVGQSGPEGAVLCMGSALSLLGRMIRGGLLHRAMVLIDKQIRTYTPQGVYPGKRLDTWVDATFCSACETYRHQEERECSSCILHCSRGHRLGPLPQLNCKECHIPMCAVCCGEDGKPMISTCVLCGCVLCNTCGMGKSCCYDCTPLLGVCSAPYHTASSSRRSEFQERAKASHMSEGHIDENENPNDEEE